MTTQFPSGLDNFANPTPADNLNNILVLHSDQHSNENDAIEAIEAWVGISGTSAQASHEYRLKQLENTPPGMSQFGVVGQDEGVTLGTGTVLNVTGDNVSLSLSGTVLNLSHTNPAIAFPQEVIGIYGQNQGLGLGTGSTFNVTETDLNLSRSGTVLNLARATGTTVYLGVNGSRLFTYTASGTYLIISNSPDPQDNIGVMGQDEGVPLGTGTVFNVTGDNVSLSLSGTVLNLAHTNPTITFPQEVIGVMGQDEGIPLGTGTTLNVVGSNIALSLSGTVLNLVHTNPAFPQEVIGIYGQDEGVGLGTGTILNVVGTGAFLSISGTVLHLNISGSWSKLQIQDIVGAMFVDTSTIDYSYGGGSINSNVSSDTVTLENGWILKTEAWTRTGNHTFTVATDVTLKYRKGAKVRYDDGNTEYGVIASSSHATGTTTVNLIPNTDYAMAATTINSRYLSYIENPEAFPHWFNWQPTYSASASMTYTSVTTDVAKWSVVGKMCNILLRAFGTVGGTPDIGLLATVPVNIATTLDTALAANTFDSTNKAGIGFVEVSSQKIRILKYDASNWGAGATKYILAQGSYEF